MSRTWTDEEKKIASERAHARLAAKASASAVAVAEPESEYESEVMRPDGKIASDDGASHIAQTDVFIARMKAQKAVTTVDDLANLGGEDADILEPNSNSNVEHTSAGLVWMYKHEPWGWRRLKVSRNSVTELIGAGFLDRCGLCASTRCPGTPNGCSAGKMRQYRDCPVAGCNDGRGKRMYDMTEPGKVKAEAPDPYAIVDDAYSASTPELRTKAMLDAHIRAYHETEAIARGLMSISQAQTG